MFRLRLDFGEDYETGDPLEVDDDDMLVLKNEIGTDRMVFRTLQSLPWTD